MARPRERFLLLATSIAYILIAFEVLFMITPFALYFYGVYGPILEWLSNHHLTAWTTEFFLPHMVFVDTPLLKALGYLQALFVIGLALFFLAAAPLYYGRLTGKGVVTFGPYARLRHPQYLFLAISGFGLLLYWPRFIVLIFYIIMLFVYYLLARNEEWRMRREQPDTYPDYMQRTWMFLPGEPGAWLYRLLFGWSPSRAAGLTLCFLVTMVLSVGAAFSLRAITLQALTQVDISDLKVISVYPRPANELHHLVDVSRSDARVTSFLQNTDVHLAYLMPGDFFLTGLILQEGPRFSEQVLKRFPYLRKKPMQGHNGSLAKFFRLGYKFFKTIGTTRRVYDYERLVFVETLDVDGHPVGTRQVLQTGVRRLPALVVDIDAETFEVLSVSEASGNNAWGRLPMPNF